MISKMSKQPYEGRVYTLKPQYNEQVRQTLFVHYIEPLISEEF